MKAPKKPAATAMLTIIRRYNALIKTLPIDTSKVLPYLVAAHDHAHAKT
jgi:hypothetical protein